jgi:hypothetical protein
MGELYCPLDVPIDYMTATSAEIALRSEHCTYPMTQPYLGPANCVMITIYLIRGARA